MVRLLRKAAIPLTLLLVLAVMVMIFSFSAQKAEASHRSSSGIVAWLMRLLMPDMDGWDAAAQSAMQNRVSFLVRKTAHVAEYLLLGFSLFLHVSAWRACREIPTPRLLSFAVGLLYAASDEFHQRFVSGRSASAVDVLLDGFGVLLGILLLSMLTRLYGKKHEAGEGEEHASP